MEILKEIVLSNSATTMDIVKEILDTREDLLIKELGNKALINELIEVCLKIEHWHDIIEKKLLAGVVWEVHAEPWLAHWLQKFDLLFPQFELLLVEWEHTL